MVLNKAVLINVVAALGVASTIGLGSWVTYSIIENRRKEKWDSEVIDLTSGWSINEVENTLRLNEFASNGAKGCDIELSGNGASSKKVEVKNALQAKLASTGNLTEENRRYRRGFLRKCRAEKNKVSLDVELQTINISPLFDLSKEELNGDERQLVKNDAWIVPDGTLNKVNNSASIEVEAGLVNDNISVGICKIIGDLEGNGSMEENKWNDSKAEVKSAIEEHISENSSEKETKRMIFLNRCKRSYDNEIRLKMKLNSEGNKYELVNLENIFKQIGN